MTTDRHNTRRLARILAILASAIFAALGIAGYNRTDDVNQLVLFLGLSIFSYMLVTFIFIGVNKLLDAIDEREH